VLSVQTCVDRLVDYLLQHQRIAPR
jgi:hypothetical protein